MIALSLWPALPSRMRILLPWLAGLGAMAAAHALLQSNPLLVSTLAKSVNNPWNLGWLIAAPGLLAALVFNWWLVVRPLRRRLADVLTMEHILQESLENGVVVNDATGRVLGVNHTAQHLLGSPRADLIGQSVRELIPGIGLPKAPEPYLPIGYTQLSQTIQELEYPRPDGQKIPLRIIASAARTQPGHPSQIWVLEDQSPRRRLERKAMNLQARLDGIVSASTGVALIICDVQGTISLLNPGAEELLGNPATSVLRRGTLELFQFHPPDELSHNATSFPFHANKPMLEQWLQYLQTHGQGTWYAGIQPHHAARAQVLITAGPIRDPMGQTLGFVIVITPRSRTAPLIGAPSAAAASDAKSDKRLSQAQAHGKPYAPEPKTSFDDADALLSGHHKTPRVQSQDHFHDDAEMILQLHDFLFTCRNAKQIAHAVTNGLVDLFGVRLCGFWKISRLRRTSNDPIPQNLSNYPTALIADAATDPDPATAAGELTTPDGTMREAAADPTLSETFTSSPATNGNGHGKENGELNGAAHQDYADEEWISEILSSAGQPAPALTIWEHTEAVLQTLMNAVIHTRIPEFHHISQFPTLRDGPLSKWVLGAEWLYICAIPHPQGLPCILMTLGDCPPSPWRERVMEIVCRMAGSALERQEILHAADQATRAKSEFLANVSHELRTPLTAILGYADTLRPLMNPNANANAATGTANGDPAKSAQMTSSQGPSVNKSLQAVIRNGGQLLQLIDDLLILSQLEADRLELDWMVASPWRLVEEVMERMAVWARERGLRFKATANGPLPRLIPTDPVRLRQMLVNLTANAIKFTTLGHVTIRVSAVPEYPAFKGKDLGMLEFQIEDTGIGMSSQHLSKLFEPFGQVDSTAIRRYGGAGLGLSIVQRLTNKLGGEVSARSQLGLGSQFTIRLPIPRDCMKDSVTATPWILEREAPIAHVKEHESSHVGLGIYQGQVLVVDDCDDNRDLFAEVLDRIGLKITIAESGECALNLCENTSYDLILMDIQMPDMDGFTTLNALREAEYTRPIVALTAHALPIDRERCLQSGFDDYLRKPLEYSELNRVLKRFLRMPNPEDETSFDQKIPAAPAADVGAPGAQEAPITSASTSISTSPQTHSATPILTPATKAAPVSAATATATASANPHPFRAGEAPTVPPSLAQRIAKSVSVPAPAPVPAPKAERPKTPAAGFPIPAAPANPPSGTTDASTDSTAQGSMLSLLNASASRELMKKFIEIQKKRLQDMENVCHTGDWKNLQAMAHKTSGSAGMYGYRELGNIAYDMEMAVIENQTRDPHWFLDRIAMMSSLLDSIARSLAEDAPTA